MISLLLWLALATPSFAEDPAPVPIVPPVLVEDATPEYPDEAKTRGLQGDVVVRVTIAPDGSVSAVEVVGSVHPLLDLPSLEAARHLRFQPATQSGQPVEVQIDYRFHFSIGLSDQQGVPVPGTLIGYVQDADGLPVPNAQVHLLNLDDPDAEPLDFHTDENGRFKAAFVPSGTWRVQITSATFAPGSYDIAVNAGETVETELPIAAQSGYEVVVFGDRQTWRDVQRGALEPNPGTVTGAYTLTRRDIESTPGALEDVARVTHSLPGVVSDGDLLAGFHVRGGEMSDVVFTLDRVPLDNPFHLAGFNSLFNPDMIREVQFFAGAAPADVPSGISAVMAVESWDGEPRQDSHDLDGAIDISASSARAMLMGPIGKGNDLTVAVAARRTYLEAYFQVMKWANLLDSAFAAPEYSELSGRVAWRPKPGHRLILTVLRSGDSLALVDSEDESTIGFSGAFELRNSLWLISADHRYLPSEALEVRTTVAWTRDKSFLRRDLGGVTERTYLTNRGFARTALSVGNDVGRLQVGVDASVFDLSAGGDVEDGRAGAKWANTGIVDLGEPLANLSEIDPWGEVSGYAQAHYDGPLKARAGARVKWSGLTGEVLVSPSAGLSLPLPTATIPKLSAGVYYRTPHEPIVVDPALGNPKIQSERAAHIVFGLDQGLPLPWKNSGGLFRVEGWHIALNRLIVNPDNPGAIDRGTTFTNDGTGRSTGIDFLLAARTGRLQGMATYSVLWAKRINPLNEVFPDEISPPQDQRHTFGVTLEAQVHTRWRLTARYAFHTGRPVSQVVAATQTTAALSCLNCERLKSFHGIDLRAEWRKAYRKFRLSIYLEVLNATNFKSPFTPMYSVKEGVLDEGMLYHLPIRPFLGIRADF